MAIDSLTPFPSPPLLGQDQATFNTNASNTLSSMDTFVTELNTSFGQFDIAKTAVETSETNASTSESNALTSENTATTKALEASNSATAALNAQTAAEAIYDTFDDMYLGVKETEPTLDNDGDALKNGAVYIKEVVDSPNQMFVYDLAQTIWVDMSYVPTSFNGLNEINLGSLSDKDTIVYDLASGTWKNVPYSITTAPTLSGLAEVAEVADLIITITNYSDTATYTNVTTSGSAVRVGDTITVTAGNVSSTEAHTLTVTAQEPSHSESLDAVHNFNVTDFIYTPDTDAYIDMSGTGINATNVPTITNGELIVTVGDESLHATSANAIFTSATVTKSDAEGDWNGTQADSFVTSSLPNIMSSADATTFTSTISLAAGEVVYLGDGTDFEEFTVLVTGTSHTHNQSFTPTYVCNKDNVSMDVSFDGTNYNTLVKSSAVADSDMVVPNTANDEFETVLYTGDIALIAGNEIQLSNITTGVDFLWIKRRNGAVQHHIFDSIRPLGESLHSDSTDAEEDRTAELLAMGTSSFTVAGNIQLNGNSDTMVAWCASLPTKSGVLGNTDGTIASTTMSNSFMSVVSYTANATYGTVGHGLSTTPQLILMKNRDATSSWIAFTTAVDGSYDYLILNDVDAKADAGSASPTSTVISANNYTAGNKLIAYAFTSVEGLCKVGSYTGTGASGNEVDCGFEPAWVMIKSTNLAENWDIWDNKRGDGMLRANLSTAETAVYDIELTSTGFTINSTNNEHNGGTGEYIYLAIAKNSPEDLRIKELHSEYLETTNTGTDLGFKVNHKEQDTKTTAVYAALYEGA